MIINLTIDTEQRVSPETALPLKALIDSLVRPELSEKQLMDMLEKGGPLKVVNNPFSAPAYPSTPGITTNPVIASDSTRPFQPAIDPEVNWPKEPQQEAQTPEPAPTNGVAKPPAKRRRTTVAKPPVAQIEETGENTGDSPLDEETEDDLQLPMFTTLDSAYDEQSETAVADPVPGPVTEEQLRAVVQIKAVNGLKANIKKLLDEIGVVSVSSIPKEMYPEIYQKVMAL